MRKAEFPERSCREGIAYSIGFGEDAIPMMANCELPDHLGLENPGPCASFTVPSSVRLRDAWEAAQERLDTADLDADNPEQPEGKERPETNVFGESFRIITGKENE